jgi:N-sulfoglucosamine sulfohydrolase
MLSLGLIQATLHAEMPNFLVITADDMNSDSLGINACPVEDPTPNIDRLAREGILFRRAHVASTACQPSRVAVNTGRVGHRSGGEGFHTLRFKNIPTLPVLLRKAGYKVGIIGKVVHSTPYQDTPWDVAIEVGRNTDEIVSESIKFMKAAQAEGKPYYLIVNSHDPHRPYYNIDSKPTRSKQRKKLSKKDEEKRSKIQKALTAVEIGFVNGENSQPSRVYRPEEVHVPYDLPDVEKVRWELACYYSSVRRCDDVVGGLMDYIRTHDEQKKTMVTFFSDHGMAKPNAKSNVYPQSTLTPLIISMPSQFTPRMDESSFVSTLDLLPTYLEMAGAKVPEGFDGESMLKILKGDASKARSSIHTQFYSIIGKKNYQMRCYQDQEFAFIYNAWHTGEALYKSSALGGEAFKAMVKAGQRDDKWLQRAEFVLRRAPEEFYDLKKDPLCQNNLVDHPEFQNKIQGYRKTMTQRMRDTDDYLLEIYESFQKNGDLEQMKSHFSKVLTEQGVVGKAPSLVLDVHTVTEKKKRK